MEVKAYARVSPPSTWNSEADVLSTDPVTLKVMLQGNTKLDDSTYEPVAWDSGDNCNDNVRVDNVCFDIHPGSAYAYGASASDMADTTSGVENIVIDTAT